MIIDTEDNFVAFHLDKRTDVVLMSCDEAQKCVNSLKEFCSYVQYIEPIIKPIEEIWEIKFGLHDTGVAIKFNKNTKKVRFPYKIALEIAKRLQNAIDSYKRGFSLKFVNISK